MKIKDGYKMRTIDGEHLVVATGSAVDLGAMVTLNDTGAFLWERLAAGATRESLLAALLEESPGDANLRRQQDAAKKGMLEE